MGSLFVFVKCLKCNFKRAFFSVGVLNGIQVFKLPTLKISFHFLDMIFTDNNYEIYMCNWYYFMSHQRTDKLV